MIKSKIVIDIYDKEIEFIISENYCSESVYYINKKYKTELDRSTKGLAFNPLCNAGEFAIVVVADASKNISIGTISHETTHMAVDIIDYIGDKIKPGVNDEQVAYLAEYICSKIYAIMCRHKYTFCK